MATGWQHSSGISIRFVQSYLAPASSQNRVCLETCRRVQAIDLDGEITVDLKLWPQGEDYEAMQKKETSSLSTARTWIIGPFRPSPKAEC